MEHRDQKHESHGVHICNKCGWPFPNPHPSAKHRRAHRRVCGKIEGFKSVESEANTHLTLSDDDGDHRNSSPKGLGGSCNDKVIDGMRKKSKGFEDEVFSDAVAEFSGGVGPNKSVGDASDSVSTTKMAAEDEMNSSQTLKDREILDLVPSSSSSTENQKVENSVAESTINQPGREQESKIKQEFVNLETDFRTGDSVILLDDHMNTTATGDLYPIEPEMVISALQQERNVNSVETAPQCSLPSPDRIFDEKKNEGFSVCRNLPEIAASSGKIDDDKSEPVPPKMEETIEMPTELTAHYGTLLSMVDDDMFIHSEMPPSVVVSDVKSCDLTQITSDAGKEIESASPDNLLETGKIKEGNENVHLPSVSSDLSVVDRPEALVEDLKDHKEVKLTNFVIQSPCEGVDVSEDNFKEHIPEESYFTFPAEPFDQASEVASFDTKTVENSQKQESGGNKVPVDVEADCFKNSGQEVEENPVQEADATRIKGVLSENERQDKSQTLSDAGIFGIDSIPLASFSPEVEPVAPSKNSLDTFSENATEVLFDENSMGAPTGDRTNLGDNEVGIGGVCLADDDNKAGARGRHSEDSVQVHLPTNVHERDDSGGEKDKFDNPDIAGVECKKGTAEENLSVEIDSTPELTTDSRENKCIIVAEEIADESPRKLSGTESADSKKFDVSSSLDTRRSVKEDNPDSAVHVACISEVNADDHSCHVRDFNSVQNTPAVNAKEEANLVSFSNESAAGRSATSQDGGVRQLVGDAVGTTSETFQEDGGKNNIEPQLISSLIDISVDSSSRTDSLEGNWGSVSVLSTQSDLPAIIDTEVKPHARAEAEQTNLKKADAATERQHSNRSDLFEPPSFMTLVEPNGGGVQNSAVSEIQTAQNRQQPNSASLQAGWFPSYIHVANDSPGRKKNEAIIAKVTNWSAGKPHTALKNLLDDAALENKQKSPTRTENLASMIQKDEKSTKNGAIDTTVDSVRQPKSPTAQSGNREIANEWNSPARYPSDIRRERRKGKPYWAQFVCCSSVH